MDFKNHYFVESKIDEKLSDVAADIKDAGVAGVAKAAAKGVGRGLANLARGALGRTKTIAFEPNWLKELKPIDQKTYQQSVRQYANWKSQKTKLGPKKKFEVKDLKIGVLGEFSKDKFVDILAKYDSSLNQVDMEAAIQPEMNVYILNNGGKIFFMNLPVGEDGKKRKFAMGLDAKAERAFRLIHGMSFQDYSLKGDEEATSKEEKPGMKKYEIDKKMFSRLAPEPRKIKLAASNNSFSLFDMFNEEVLEEKDRYVTKDGEKWLLVKKLKSGSFKVSPDNEILTLKDNDIAVDKNGNQDEELQKQVNDLSQKEKNQKSADVENEIELQLKNNSNPTPEEEDAFGELFYEIKPDIKTVSPVKPSEKVVNGWRFLTRNNGTIFVYEGKGGNFYIAFDNKGEEIVDKYKLLTKYDIEVVDAPE